MSNYVSQPNNSSPADANTYRDQTGDNTTGFGLCGKGASTDYAKGRLPDEKKPDQEATYDDSMDTETTGTGIPVYPSLRERRENERRILQENKHHFRTSDAPFTPRFVGKSPTVRFHSHDAPFSVSQRVHVPKRAYHSSDAPFAKRGGQVGPPTYEAEPPSWEDPETRPVQSGGNLPPPPEEKKEDPAMQRNPFLVKQLNQQDQERKLDPTKDTYANPNKPAKLVGNMSMPATMVQFFAAPQPMMKYYKKKGRLGRRVASLKDQKRKWISRGFGENPPEKPTDY
jgi:hypothetical protein